MKFYYYNSMGDSGYFNEDDIVKAIYTAWNIEAELWLVENFMPKKLVFSPLETNEFNSELLNEYGYYMEDGEEYREIKDIETHEIKSYDWSEVKQLN